MKRSVTRTEILGEEFIVEAFGMTNWTSTKARQIPLCPTRTDIKITMEESYGDRGGKVAKVACNGRDGAVMTAIKISRSHVGIAQRQDEWVSRSKKLENKNWKRTMTFRSLCWHIVIEFWSLLTPIQNHNVIPFYWLERNTVQLI